MWSLSIHKARCNVSRRAGGIVVDANKKEINTINASFSFHFIRFSNIYIVLGTVCRIIRYSSRGKNRKICQTVTFFLPMLGQLSRYKKKRGSKKRCQFRAIFPTRITISLFSCIVQRYTSTWYLLKVHSLQLAC